jgi:sulfoxide reductase catalytic subunit YedY
MVHGNSLGGNPLKSLLKHVSPTNNAKFVKFTTLNRPSEMIGQRYKVLDWPYIEGLRMDEAMHPLTILAVGLYGKVLPEPKRGPYQTCCPMEIWIQEYQSHYKNIIS